MHAHFWSKIEKQMNISNTCYLSNSRWWPLFKSYAGCFIWVVKICYSNPDICYKVTSVSKEVFTRIIACQYSSIRKKTWKRQLLKDSLFFNLFFMSSLQKFLLNSLTNFLLFIPRRKTMRLSNEIFIAIGSMKSVEHDSTSQSSKLIHWCCRPFHLHCILKVGWRQRLLTDTINSSVQ